MKNVVIITNAAFHRRRAATEWRLFGIAAVLVVVTASADARGAEPTSHAPSPLPTEDELIKQGVDARRRDDDSAALELFRRAYGVSHSSRAAAQMGLAELALGQWLEAETHLEEATATAKDPWIAKNAGALAESLTRVRQNLGNLDVVGSPAGAQVVVEGKARGSLPLAKPIRVRSGECRFEIRAQGYESLVRSVQIYPGELTRETVDLPPARSPSPPMYTPPAPIDSTTPPSLVHHGTGSARLRTVAYILGGVGIVAIGTGLAFGLKARSAGESDSQRTMFDPGADSNGHHYQTLQWVGYGIGASMLAAGGLGYYLGVRQASEPTTTVSFVPMTGGGMASIGGSL
jgi:hypothetical protein